MMDDLFEETKLIPVSQWEWRLFKVEWARLGGEKTELIDWCVSTDTHIDGEVDRRWPNPYFRWAGWEAVEMKVAAPRQIGILHGMSLHEDGFSAGRREAKSRGLTA